MPGRRAVYLAALVCCGVFYIAYGEWLSFLVLMVVLGLPWLSLVLSLGAIWSFRVRPAGPDTVDTGEQIRLWLLGSCAFPMPPFRGKLKLTHSPSGDTLWYQEEGENLTSHCGSLTVTAEKMRICDYLGLFSFPVRGKEPKTVVIRPRPLPVQLSGMPVRQLAENWKPKASGGFSENHELRPYRPGDSLNQIHWKLSAKTGELILRQSMEPQQGLILLTMHLRGTPEETDRKFGRLLWLGSHLLERSAAFQLRVLTQRGLLTFSVEEQTDLDRAMEVLLREQPMTRRDLTAPAAGVLWQYHIGGGPDET